MDKAKLLKLLQDVKAGNIEIDQALTALKSFPYEDLGFAKLDTHRDLRTGFPEVVLCKGKTTEQITQIVAKLSSEDHLVMATKVTEEVQQAVPHVYC